MLRATNGRCGNEFSGFELWLVFAAFLSYGLLAIDLAVWCASTFITLTANE
jgi:hypothetical protein